MRVQLRIALPARSVHEPGHHPTLRGHPPAHPLRLHPGHRRALLQEPQRGFHRLPVRGRHLLGHRLRGERPQQRHALGARESQIERSHLARPRPRQQILAGHRVLPLDQGAQLAGLHHASQAQTLGPPAGPHPRRLAHPGVVLVDAQRHRRDQVLRIRQPRNRQHPPPPPTPSPSTHPHPQPPIPTAITPPTTLSSPPTGQPTHRHLPRLRRGNRGRRHDDPAPEVERRLARAMPQRQRRPGASPTRPISTASRGRRRPGVASAVSGATVSDPSTSDLSMSGGSIHGWAVSGTTSADVSRHG